MSFAAQLADLVRSVDAKKKSGLSSQDGVESSFLIFN